jgi:hypothetical protein
MILVDGGANEGVMVIDADFGDVPRVIADGDGTPDERCQGGREVALTLEVDAVALHDTVPRDSEEESGPIARSA